MPTHYNWLNRPLNPNEIVSALQSGEVILVRIGWTDGNGNLDGSGHYVALTAFDANRGVVHIEDPWYGASDGPYPLFVRHYQNSGVWTETFIVDGLLRPPGGMARVGQPIDASALFQRGYQLLETRPWLMRGEVALSVRTLGLQEALSPHALSLAKTTGEERISAEAITQTGDRQPFLRYGAEARRRHADIIAATEQLENPEIIQIPALYVTALMGGRAGQTQVVPVGEVPKFLQRRAYNVEEFESAIREPAQRKLDFVREEEEERTRLEQRFPQ